MKARWWISCSIRWNSTPPTVCSVCWRPYRQRSFSTVSGSLLRNAMVAACASSRAVRMAARSGGRLAGADAPALDIIAVHLHHLVARLGAEVIHERLLQRDPLRQVLAEHHEYIRLPPGHGGDGFGQLRAVGEAPVQAGEIRLQ